jgi:TRAP-type C4-dicarboxylate transport system permease small subunit
MLLKIKHAVDKFIEGIIVAMLFCMFIIVLIQVFTRFVLDNPSSWTEEVARYLMVWMGFLGAGVGLKYGLHMSLDIVSARARGTFKKVLLVVGCLLTLVVGLLFLTYGYRYMLQGRQRLSMALQFEMYYVFMAFPVSGALIIANSLETLATVVGLVKHNSVAPKND